MSTSGQCACVHGERISGEAKGPRALDGLRSHSVHVICLDVHRSDKS